MALEAKLGHTMSVEKNRRNEYTAIVRTGRRSTDMVCYAEGAPSALKPGHIDQYLESLSVVISARLW